MGNGNPYAGLSQLRNMCELILDENKNEIHRSDLIHLLNKRGYWIQDKEFDAMLPRIALKLDKKNKNLVRKAKRAYHGEHSEQSELRQTEITAEVN